jgi:hypothetical protein
LQPISWRQESDGIRIVTHSLRVAANPHETARRAQRLASNQENRSSIVYRTAVLDNKGVESAEITRLVSLQSTANIEKETM